MSEIMLTVPPDGVQIITTEESLYADGCGKIISNVHDPSACSDRPCVIHHPSEHSMREFPTNFRDDRYLMERICPHGVGHPDPDDIAWRPEADRPTESVHGCDGCCAP